MPTLERNIFVLIFVLSSCLTFGQVQGKTKALTGMQEDSLFSIMWQKEQDSLRTAFYKQPKLINLKYEINGKTKPFRGRFFVIVDSTEIEIKQNDMGQYEVTFLVDTSQTVIIKILTSKMTFTEQLSKPTGIRNGASITFGVVTDIQKQSKKGIRITRKEDDELSKRDEFYNEIFQSERILNLARQKKISRIEYFQITPRVYGCGTSAKTITYY